MVSLEELLPPNGEKIPPQHGTLCEKIPAHGEKIPLQHDKSRKELIEELPMDLLDRVNKLGKRASRETNSQLIVDLCSYKPYSYEELAKILQRASKPFKDKYLKPLRLANKLFYWIPEMINHPQQRYIADPSMARSKTKNNNKNDHK